MTIGARLYRLENQVSVRKSLGLLLVKFSLNWSSFLLVQIELLFQVTHVDRKLEGMTQMLKVVLQRQEEMFDFHRANTSRLEVEEQNQLQQLKQQRQQQQLDAVPTISTHSPSLTPSPNPMTQGSSASSSPRRPGGPGGGHGGPGGPGVDPGGPGGGGDESDYEGGSCV